MRRMRQCTIRGPVDIYRAMEITYLEAERAGFSDNQTIFLQLATEEACSNACQYAMNSLEKPIIVTWRVRRSSLVVTVRQTGNPFPLKEEGGINKGARGRGLQLIMKLMDEVKLICKGQYVYLRMTKMIEPTSYGG